MNHRPLYIVEGIRGMNINQLAAEARRLVRKHGVKFILVDYLQKIAATQSNEKRTYEVGQVSTGLKAVAFETNAAVLSLAQLNRENEKEKGRMPRMSDLGDSKQIEQDADFIGLLHRSRDPELEHEATLLVCKQRDGDVGKVPLNFIGEFCRFENPPQEQPSTQSPPQTQMPFNPVIPTATQLPLNPASANE